MTSSAAAMGRDLAEALKCGCRATHDAKARRLAGGGGMKRAFAGERSEAIAPEVTGAW